VLYSFAYALVRLLLEVLIRPQAAERQARRRGAGAPPSARVLVQKVGRSRWEPADHLLLAAPSRGIPSRPRARSSACAVKKLLTPDGPAMGD
jgi:nitroreductase